MPDLMLRALWLAAAAGLAVGIGVLASRARRASQPAVRLDGLGVEGAVVAFTSTDCENCAKVMSLLSEFDVPVREVAHELEPVLFEAAGVGAVPLVVVVDHDGSAIAQFGGVPSRSRVRRALIRAGW